MCAGKGVITCTSSNGNNILMHMKYSKTFTDDTHSSDQDPDSEAKTLQEAEDPFNEKGSADAGDGFEANFEAHFDANFDDAFSGGAQSADINAELRGDDVQTPKQVVGGRASIPEELDSNQLARLQNLKESNA